MKQFDINPDKNGYFGSYGGQLIPKELKKLFDEVATEYEKYRNDEAFVKELRQLQSDFTGRPSPLFFASRLTNECSGAKIYLKREDCNHTGAHKINHCLIECLLAKRMGKTRVVAETGAGQHGVALATAAAQIGISCEIFMGEKDIEKQAPNVARMKILGAKLTPVSHGGKSLKEAVDAAIESFAKDNKFSFFAIGSVVGPAPFPQMIRDAQRIIGEEVREQFSKKTGGKMPDHLIACVGGGSNAIGLFSDFLENKEVQMYGVEPAGKSLTELGKHAATLSLGTPGNIHGMHTYLLKNPDESPAPVHSIASGLDYPGVGPQHSFLKDCDRVKYETVTDQEALKSFHKLSRREGIIPALESAHALAFAEKLAAKLPKEETIVVNLSGRGDKDLGYVLDLQENN